MNRREFGVGLAAASVATPAIASNVEIIVPRGRITLDFDEDDRDNRVKDIWFILPDNGSAVRYFVNREFEYREEDRKIIKGFSVPRIADKVEEGELVGRLTYSGTTLYASQTIQLNYREYDLEVGNDDRTYQLGGFANLRREVSASIPALGNTKPVGGLFRRESGGRRDELLVYISPSLSF